MKMTAIRAVVFFINSGGCFMRQRVMIYLGEEEKQALISLAIRELRDPRDQATLIIRKGLADLGLIEKSNPGIEKRQSSQPAKDR
jgi:hypothetical protein